MKQGRLFWGVTTTVLVAFFIAFLVYPLWDILNQAFVASGQLTGAFFGLMLRNPVYQELLVNSLDVAVLVTMTVSVIAFPLAFVMVRWRLPSKNLLHTLVIVPLVLPPFVGAIGLKQLLGRFGTLNLVLSGTGIISSPIDWLAPGRPLGVVLMQTVHLVPLAYLYLRAGFIGVQPVLEEAASSMGASAFTLFRRITFPILLPTYFATAVLVFVSSFTDLGTPLLFEYRKVVPVQIFYMLTDLNENHTGYALVVFLSCMSVWLFFLSRKIFADGSVVASERISSAGREKPIGRLLAGATASLIVALSAIGMLPHIGVLLLSLSEKWFLTPLPAHWTVMNYVKVFHHPVTTPSIAVSLGLSIASTLMVAVVGFLISYLTVRRRGFGATVLDVFSILPLAVPGMVFAFGYVRAFSGTILDPRVFPIPLLIIAYAIRRLPPMVRACTAGLASASATLEEAAEGFGASRAVVLRRVVFPLIARHVVAAGILCFAYSMLEVSDSLLLAMEERYFPISKALYSLISRPDGPELASALGVLVTILLVVSFWLSSKISRDGATTEAPEVS